MPQLSLHSPVGDITVSEENGNLISLAWGWGMEQTKTPLLKKAKKQLEAYFDGSLKKFTLPLNPAGTPFAHLVGAEMRRIPYGKTLSYSELAFLVENHPRAIGQVCANNPIPIIIPCHRVLGAKDTLGGYSGEGGLVTKCALLALEGVLL